MFVPPRELIVLETEHWRVNHRVGVRLPGYLIMGPTEKNVTRFAGLSPAAQGEMGPLLARVSAAMEEHLRPRNLYVGRYGHTPGHSLHFHLIPVYDWVAEAFAADERYRVLRQFYSPGVPNSGLADGFDGAEMTLFIWRELAESRTSRNIPQPDVEDTVRSLRRALKK